MHELRAPGYRPLVASDPQEQALRAKWYETRAALEADGNPDTGQARQAFQFVDAKLCKYLWDRCQADIAADRKAHPKARRNQPVPPRDPEAMPTRVLP